jgi:hypothetical protein
MIRESQVLNVPMSIPDSHLAMVKLCSQIKDVLPLREDKIVIFKRCSNEICHGG